MELGFLMEHTYHSMDNTISVIPVTMATFPPLPVTMYGNSIWTYNRKTLFSIMNNKRSSLKKIHK